MIDFSAFSLSANIVIFILAAGVVWVSGTKIATYADVLAERTGLGQALMGLFLLAGVTSLPEIATSFTAASVGNADLAVNNLLGSVAMQVAVLAVADLVIGKRALTSVVPDPVVMLQGALNICLLALVAVAAIVGDIPVFTAGAWSWGLFAGAVYSFIKLSASEGRQPWIANLDEDIKATGAKERASGAAGMLSLSAKTAVSAAAILLAGYVVARSGEAIALQSGLGSSFVGVAFVAIATSLPEASTVFAAMRLRLYTMAISDIFGTNILNVALLLGVDIVAPGAPVLSRVGDFAAIAAMLGVVVTGVFLMGLAERRDRTIWRMGVDSALVLAIYAGGVILLYNLRGA